MKVIARAIGLLLVVGLFFLATNANAQSKQGSAFRPNPNLNDQEKRGEHWFLQRCALCHLAKYRKSASESDLPPIWWSLEGLFKDAQADKEEAVRTFILKGTQKMPGFQYTLKPNEIDDLVVYLKTF